MVVLICDCVLALEVKDTELWISQTAVLIKGISHEGCVSVYKTKTADRGLICHCPDLYPMRIQLLGMNAWFDIWLRGQEGENRSFQKES